MIRGREKKGKRKEGEREMRGGEEGIKPTTLGHKWFSMENEKLLVSIHTSGIKNQD